MTNDLTVLQQAAVDALKECNGNLTAAADKLGIGRTTMRDRIRYAAMKGHFPFGPNEPAPGFEITKVTTDNQGDVVSTQQRPEGAERETLPAGHIIKGVSSLLDQNGAVRQQWIKTRAENAVPDVIAVCKEAFKDINRLPDLDFPNPMVSMTNPDLLTVYPIADQHHGLLAWGKETGEAYDVKIGAARLRDCTRRLMVKSDPSTTGLILNLGDWQHTDDQKNMTPGHSNILDVDSRYFKILTSGVLLMRDVVELGLQRHENMIVRNLPGNHDPHASIALTIALHAFYHDNPRVTVDMDPSDYFFHRFGQTLIGATHGHKQKPEKMAMTMAVLRREDWGQTKYHHFMHGHIHHETAREVGDCRVESFQSITAKDAFAHSHGYLAGQSLQSITFDKDDGEIGRHRVNIFNYGRPE